VRDEDDESRVEGDTVLAAGATRGFLLRPDLSGLSIGSYVLELSVEEGKRRWRTESDFEVEVVSAPQGRDWDTFLEILDYVASRPEMQALRAAQTPAERSRLWDEFWARRDPTPGTSRNEALFEFMRRVRYANTQFAGLGPGWRTDQGRIYIRYGAPDQIEDISATPTSPPLQVWHYLTANRRFVFADRYGFGRYELVSGEEP
jgi:GWxTD domain-containing protein